MNERRVHPEYAVSVEYYLLQSQLKIDLLSLPCVVSPSSAEREENAGTSECDKSENDKSSPPAEQGKQFSIEGPASYQGDILDDPELLWSEDVWTAEKEEEAKQRLQEQGANVSDYWRGKYEQQAGVYWHKFYKRHLDHFFKDRHYLHVVFPELLMHADQPVNSSNTIRLLEVGCGVGNAVIPLLDVNPNMYVVAVDFAKSAIEILSKHPAATELRRLEAYVHDVVSDTLPLPEESLDLILCMFVVSAITPKRHIDVFSKLFRALKPGGKLLFRDYGRYDEAQLRFKKGSKLDDNFYVRQDGTCSYFFTCEELRTIAETVGFECEELDVILRQYANRQQRKARHRCWIHMKIKKPFK